VLAQICETYYEPHRPSCVPEHYFNINRISSRESGMGTTHTGTRIHSTIVISHSEKQRRKHSRSDGQTNNRRNGSVPPSDYQRNYSVNLLTSPGSLGQQPPIKGAPIRPQESSLLQPRRTRVSHTEHLSLTDTNRCADTRLTTKPTSAPSPKQTPSPQPSSTTTNATAATRPITDNSPHCYSPISRNRRTLSPPTHKQNIPKLA
jgi:hypothetical protein